MTGARPHAVASDDGVRQQYMSPEHENLVLLAGGLMIAAWLSAIFFLPRNWLEFFGKPVLLGASIWALFFIGLAILSWPMAVRSAARGNALLYSRRDLVVILVAALPLAQARDWIAFFAFLVALAAVPTVWAVTLIIRRPRGSME